MLSRRLLLFVLAGAISYLSIAGSLLLAKETDENRPLTTLGGDMTVDPFTGTATTSIPIEVPRGRNGMQPTLQLVYASLGGNDWLGQGWKLEHEGIFRQTKYGVNYALNTGPDAFVVKMAGISGDLVQAPPPAASTEWRGKIEASFSKIEKLTAIDGQPYWKVTTKQGGKSYFGQTDASRVRDPQDATRIVGWCLDRVEDPDGNYMTLTYWGDAANNRGYLDRVEYGGNNGSGGGTVLPHTHSVKFWLDDGSRPDQPDLYSTTYRSRTKYRLKTIEVKGNGSLVRAYELSYSTSASTNRSVLTSVKQHGKDAGVDASGTITPGTSLPATTFSYSGDTQTFTDGAAWATGWCSGGTINSGADVNGDGKQDLWCKNTANNPQVLTSNGAGGFATWSPYVTQGPWIAGDFTGDGKSDLSYAQGAVYPCGPPGVWCARFTFIIAPSNLTGASSGTVWFQHVGCADCIGPAPNAVGDFNGDGKLDLAVLSGGVNYVALSTGSDFSGGTWSFNSWCIGGSLGTADFNGDGQADLSCKNSSGTISVATSTGTSFTGGGAWISSWCASGQFDIADFNGDGKQDISCHPTDGTTKIALSTGSTFVDGSNGSNWVTGFCATGKFGTGDFNGDGKQDVYCHPSDGTTQVALSTGSAFVINTTPWFSSWCTTGTYGVGDFNGDGKADVYCFNGGTVSVARSGASLVTPDLLTSVSNGLGGAVTISYAPSTQWTNTQLPFPLQWVNALTQCDNWDSVAKVCAPTGTSSTTTYSYSGGYYHIGERDVRGVNSVKVTGPAGPTGEQTVTETWFHQGNDVAVDVNTPSGAVGYTKGLPYRTKVSKVGSPNMPLIETTTSYLADSDSAAPWFTPPALVTTTIYDSAGVLVKQTQTESVTYDAYGNLTLAYNRGDATTNNALTSDDTTMAVTFGNYDTTNWLVAFPTVQTTYAGLGTTGTKLAETKYFYDGASSCTTPAGNLIPTKGHVSKVERYLDQGGSNPISGMVYNSYGSLTCTRDPLGNTTTLAYDPTSTFPLTSTNALGHVTTSSYYGVNGVAMDTGVYGQVKTVQDANLRTATNTYDALGRTVTTTTPDGLITTLVYNHGGTFGVGTQHLQSTTSGGGLTTNLVSKTYFDGLGRTIKTESPGAADGGGALKVRVTEIQYDSRGLVKQSSLPYIQGTESATGRWRVPTYDALGRTIQMTQPDTTTSQVCYNGWVTTSIDPKLHKKVETKDAYGRVSTVQEYTSTQATCTTTGGTLYATTTYQYTLLGNLLSVTDTKGNVSTMTYDTLGRKLTMHDPDMSNWSYTYDANGNLVTQVDAKNQKLCFTYDALNRRTQKNFGTTTVACGTNTVVYTYDDTVTTYNLKGRLKQVTDPAQSVTFQYDSRGRITQSAKTLDGTTYTTASAYDGLGRLTSVNYPTTPIKTVTYTYDGPQLKSVLEGATTYVTYAGWNALGQSATSTFANGVVTTNTYANTNNTTCTQQTFRLCTLKTQKGANPLYQDLRYDYEANGNVWNIYDVTVAGNAGDQHFSYDDLDRLTLANGPYGASGANASFTYQYNEIGNLTLNSQLSATAYGYPISGASSVRPHAVTTAGANTYAYDNNGNMTGGAGRTYTWNQENKPLTIVQGGTTTTFVYDGDGGRVKKIVGTMTTRYLSKLYECDNTNCSRFIWAGSTRIATIASNGVVNYWHGDHLGSSSVITDAAGTKVEALTYYPYGGTRTNTSPNNPAIDVPYKYTGKELDASTGLYYYEARYYDATLARFISADTIVESPSSPQVLNRYSYVGNNPLRYTDPSGHCFIVCIKFSKSDLRTLKTVGGVALQVFGGPVGIAAGTYLLTTSKDGRYILAGEILVGAAVASWYCGGCAAAPLIYGGAIGAWSGAAVGGYSAIRNGGDLSSGVLFGSAIGGVTGAFMGYAAPTGELFNSLSYVDKIIVSAKVGAAYGAAGGAASGYAGGVGDIVDILKGAGIGAASGALTGAVLQATAPALSKLAGDLVDNLKIGETRLGDILTAVKNISLHPGVPGPFQGYFDLATNIGLVLDANRTLILGGGATIGSGIILNDQVLPLVRQKCTESSPCAYKGKF